MATPKQEQILKAIFNRFYVRRKKESDEAVLRIGARKLKRRTIGWCGTEVTMPEEQVYGLLVKLGAAKKLEEAKELAPHLDGLVMDYTSYHILRIEKIGAQLPAKNTEYRFTRVLRDTNSV